MKGSNNNLKYSVIATKNPGILWKKLLVDIVCKGMNITLKIIESIEKLPSKGDIKKLKGKKVKNIFRLRIGKYRVIYFLEKDVIKVIKIDTRGDVYK